MKTSPNRLTALLAFTVLVACDDGSAAAKATPAKAEVAKNVKAEPAKAEPAKVEPAKVEPAAVEPVNTVPAKVEPAAVEPTEEIAEPSDPAEPTEPTEIAAPSDTAAVATGGVFSPISIGSDAELLKLVLAHDVVNRQPVDPATTFASGTKVNLFVEARNESDADIKLSVTWENVKSGRRSPPVALTIPVRKLHRTRAYRTLKLVGEQRVIVLGEGGEELAVLPFTIE